MNIVSRVLRYAVGNKNGNRRVYIQNQEDMQAANFHAGTRFNCTRKKNTYLLTPCINGAKRVISPARGSGIIELSDKAFTEFLGHDTQYISAEMAWNSIKIRIHHSEARRQERERLFLKDIRNKTITTGALYAGIGWLTYNLHMGMKKAGLTPRLKFANELDPIASNLNLNYNSVWSNATKDAIFIRDDIQTMDLSLLPTNVGHLEIAYPCTGHSKLTPKSKKGILHPITGKLFLQTVHAIAQTNPATLTLECTPLLLGSTTLDCITDFLNKNGYTYETTMLKGSQFGDFEHRERLCLFATSKGISNLFPKLEDIHQFHRPNPHTFKDIKEDISDTDDVWRKYEHIKKRNTMSEVGYRNVLIQDSDRHMPALVAGYAAPKAGSAFVPHKTNSDLQRQLTVKEHTRIRKMPNKLAKGIIDLAKGKLIGQLRTNVGQAHKVCGNSVSPSPWRVLSAFMFSLVVPDNNQLDLF